MSDSDFQKAIEALYGLPLSKAISNQRVFPYPKQDQKMSSKAEFEAAQEKQKQERRDRNIQLIASAMDNVNCLMSEWERKREKLQKLVDEIRKAGENIDEYSTEEVEKLYERVREDFFDYDEGARRKTPRMTVR